MAGNEQLLRLLCRALALLAAVSSGPLLSLETPDKPGDGATELEPIQVTPKINPLDESMDRLRKMLEDPDCRSCSPLLEADRESAYLKIGKALSFITGAGLEPPNPDFAQRQKDRVQNSWRRSEWGPEMDDFR